VLARSYFYISTIYGQSLTHCIYVRNIRCNSKFAKSDFSVYRVSQEECARLRESVPYVKVYRYNSKHLYSKLNGYGDNGQRKVRGLLAVPNTATCTTDTSRDNARGLERGMQCSLCLRDALRSQPCYVTVGLSHV